MTTIIFKPVKRCNASCVYCGVPDKHRTTVLSDELLELTFRRIDEFLRERPEEQVNLTWHGGEVCLLGADYFRRAWELQAEHCRGTGDRIRHLVQSNMTLLTDEIAEVWKQMGIDRVGSSYEPLPNIRGFGSRCDSRRYNEAFLRGAAVANRHGLNWGMIYVVNRRSLERPVEIFNHLTNLSPRATVQINKIYITGDDSHGLDITEEQFADFLGAVFRVWWERRDRYPGVKPFFGFVEWYTGDSKRTLVCDSSGECAHRWVFIGPDGEAGHCGRSDDFKFDEYGRITDRTLSEILGDPRRDHLLRRQEVLPQTDCKDCRFWGMCHGGCHLDARSIHGDPMTRSPRCASLTRFLTEHFEPITGMRAEFPYQA